MRLPVLARGPGTHSTPPRRRVRGRGGLIVGLHGYGSDEAQLDTLVPLDLPTITLSPRAPHRVSPGWGWWVPEHDSDRSGIELAPTAGVDEAVALIGDLLRAAQAAEGIGPERTALVGYSQGATLALSVAARHPELVAAVATGAGFLLPDEAVTARPGRPLDVLVLNGTLDPLITADDHDRTVDRLARAGHRVTGRRDPLPHVIDRAQVPLIEAHLGRALIGIESPPAGPSSRPGRPSSRPDQGETSGP